ncbi:hypothetical protein [Streptococcus halichoeri]|uniref:hypothetical protein n=1 Tax=Streptococcus halichoeri TaxID=254785 RepID=UPI0013580E32|nr:hypothetical protein [Streptococcus halichoeri]
MSKKFLQSLTILGLLSTALGVAQPVGAVTRYFYEKTEEIKKKLDEIGGKNSSMVIEENDRWVISFD